MDFDTSQKKREISPTFCIAPWTNFCTSPTGYAAVCCAAIDFLWTDQGRYYSLRQDDPETIWNSPALRNMRQAMLEGREPSACKKCFNGERTGLSSLRTHLNRTFFGAADYQVHDIDKFVARFADPNDPLSAKRPIYLDIRLGNICNLRCRTCHPRASSQVERDRVLSLWSDDVRTEPYGADLKDWPEAHQLMDKLKDFTIDGVRFDLAGGEPSLNKSQLELLQCFVDRGQAQNMDLQIFTNLTNIQAKVYDLYNAFKDIYILVSMDGYGEVFDYIRYPSRWSVVSENLKKVIKQYPKIRFGVAPTYLNYNILSICDLFDWCLEVGVNCATENLLEYAPYLRCSVLPEEAKNLAADRLDAWVNKNGDRVGPENSKNIRGLANHLRSYVYVNPQYIEDFVKYTNDLDHSRKQDIRKSLPELYEIWKRHRGWDHNDTKFFTKNEGPTPNAVEIAEAVDGSLELKTA